MTFPSQGNNENNTALSFKRARSEEQRQLRVNQFLDTAAQLYEANGYESVTLSQIAKELNFNRNNIYNYYNCKEDLFLSLILRDLGNAMEDGIQTFCEPFEAESFAEKITQLLMRHHRLLDLFSITNTMILKGASPNIHKKFRIQVKVIQDKLVRHLQEHNIINEPEDRLINLFRIINIYAIGIYPSSLEYKKIHNIKVYPKDGYGTIAFGCALKTFIKDNFK